MLHVYDFIIQLLNRQQCAHYQETSLYPSPYNWPPLPILPSHWPSSSSGSHQSVLCIYLFVLFLLIFKNIPHMIEIIHYLSFSTWCISLSLISSRYIHVAENGKISSFYDWVVFLRLCVYVPASDLLSSTLLCLILILLSFFLYT